MLHTQLQHLPLDLPHDTFKFYLKHRDKFFRDATTQASPSMLKHLSSSNSVSTVGPVCTSYATDTWIPKALSTDHWRRKLLETEGAGHAQ